MITPACEARWRNREEVQCIDITCKLESAGAADRRVRDGVGSLAITVAGLSQDGPWFNVSLIIP